MQRNFTPNAENKQKGNCPTCGFHIAKTTSFEQVLSGSFDNAENGDYEAVRITPIRAMSLESDVLVPLAQSLIWSLVVAAPTVTVAMWLRWEWSAPLFVTASSLLVSWISTMKRTEVATSKTEKFSYSSSRREPGDPRGQPRGSQPVRLDILSRSQSQFSIKFLELPGGISEVNFVEFCRGVVAGKSLARSEWTPKRNMFSRDEYDSLLSSMMDGNVVISLPGKGNRITENGKHAMMDMIQQYENTV